MIHIVDYGVGNLASISNMLKHIGVASAVTGNPSELITASKIILPGVGSFDQASSTPSPPIFEAQSCSSLDININIVINMCQLEIFPSDEKRPLLLIGI